MSASRSLTLRTLIASRALRVLLQPIVDLDDASVVGYEALTRGPAGHALESPLELFGAAREHGLLAELDDACRTAAFRTAIRTWRAAPLTLFVNLEPDVVDRASLDELARIATAAESDLRVVFEITERSMMARPAQLLSAVERIRAFGWAIALDDVGVNASSLAFMSLLRPEVVKLDLHLIQERATAEIASTMHAVNAYCEATGALLLAEGIETERHLEMARALGARYGQGWLHGRPSDEVNTRLVGEIALPHRTGPQRAHASPFECLPPGTPLRISRKALLIELSKRLEEEALGHAGTALVASTFQEARHFTPATARRYTRLVEGTAFVCAIGEGLAVEPIAGVRGAALRPDDPLTGEWDVVVIAPHFAAALLARDLGDEGPDLERRFEYAVTYRRDTVVEASRALLSRIVPEAASVALPFGADLPAAA